MNDSGAPAIDQLTTLLFEGLFAKGLQNQVRWFWSTGGITKPYGLIAGTLKARRSWRYAPTDDLMQALLLVCFTASQGSRIREAELPVSERWRSCATDSGFSLTVLRARLTARTAAPPPPRTSRRSNVGSDCSAASTA